MLECICGSCMYHECHINYITALSCTNKWNICVCGLGHTCVPEFTPTVMMNTIPTKPKKPQWWFHKWLVLDPLRAEPILWGFQWTWWINILLCICANLVLVCVRFSWLHTILLVGLYVLGQLMRFSACSGVDMFGCIGGSNVCVCMYSECRIKYLALFGQTNKWHICVYGFGHACFPESTLTAMMSTIPANLRNHNDGFTSD